MPLTLVRNQHSYDMFRQDGAEYLVRVSFGTALIVSIILVSTAIVVALLSASSSDKKR